MCGKIYHAPPHTANGRAFAKSQNPTIPLDLRNVLLWRYLWPIHVPRVGQARRGRTAQVGTHALTEVILPSAIWRRRSAMSASMRS